MEFRDASYVLSPKNSRKLRSGMVFNLVLGFTNMTEGGKKLVCIKSIPLCWDVSKRHHHITHVIIQIRAAAHRHSSGRIGEGNVPYDWSQISERYYVLPESR